MKTRLLTLDDALSLSTRPESHFFDRKSHGIKPRQIEKIAVAFSNADGGEFVIGISDDLDEPDPTTRWHGASNIEEMNQFLQSLFSLTPTLDIRYEILSHPERSGYCLRVQVEKSASVCKTSDGTVYVRQGAQSIPVKDPDRIVQLSLAKGASSFEDQEVSGVRAESIVESSILNEFLKAYSPRTDALDFVESESSGPAVLDSTSSICSSISRVATGTLTEEIRVARDAIRNPRGRSGKGSSQGINSR